MPANLGIGTTSPAAKLHVSSGTILVDGNAPAALQVGVSTFVVSASGNVGLGTPAPISQLHVQGNAGTGPPILGPGTLLLEDPTNLTGSGGAVAFGEQANLYFAGIKGFATNGAAIPRWRR